MNTLVMSLPRSPAASRVKNPSGSADFAKSPPIFQRKYSAAEGAGFTLEDKQDALTETARDLRYAFSLSQGTEFGTHKLIQRLPVLLELDDDGTFILSDELFDRYGSGGSPQSAYADLMEDLSAYYDIIAESAAKDYPAAQALLARLQQYIQRIGE